MKILSKLNNTGMIEEVEDKRYVTDAEKLTWNGKADKTYVDNKVKTDVPVGAKFTDTITTINGKTGVITKADITALGIPAQDTVVDISGKADKTEVTSLANKVPSTKELVTVETKNKHYPIIMDNSGEILGRHLTQRWYNGAFRTDSSLGVGLNALSNNTGLESNGFGDSSLRNNTGSNSNGFGSYALSENTGYESNGFGYASLQNNTGVKSNGFGNSSLSNNTGDNSNGFGSYALTSNTGSNSNGFGTEALANNTGSYSNGFGENSLRSNTGSSSNGFGNEALYNNTGSNSNGFGYQSLRNNTGSNSNGFGYQSLSNNEGDYSSGFGRSSLQYNRGSSSNGFGYESLSNNSALHSNGFGSSSLANNTGPFSNGFGNSSLSNNAGNSSNGFGFFSLQNNTGNDSNGFGKYSLQDNTGNYSNGVGHYSLQNNIGSYNTAVGHNSNSRFIDNVLGSKTCNSSDVDVWEAQITIPAHGFGANGSTVSIKYASTTETPISNLYPGTVYPITVIDANTIKFNQSLYLEGTGTHTFTPGMNYSNTTCLGANTVPNRSNQVVLGDTSVDTVKMGGTNRTPASSTAEGIKGETCWDENYFYICVATNTWKRTKLRDDQNALEADLADLALKADITYVDSKVQTDVPSGAKFTDTVTTINGKTGAITKADITALGIPAQDTVYTHPTTHSISEVSGLQTALDGKVDDSQVLTNVPLNAKFTDTVYSHPSSHPASMITESSTQRFVSDTEKATWNSKPDTDTVTTINGKTGAITKADITALGIPAQDTVVDISGKADKTYVDDKVEANIVTVLKAVYPVGAIYTSVTATNPSSIFGFGTWVSFGDGRMLVGVNTADTDFNTVEKTGGSKTNTLAIANLPAHTHTFTGNATGSAGDHSHTITVASGGGHAHTASSNSTGAHTHTTSGTAASAGDHTHAQDPTTWMNKAPNVYIPKTGSYYGTVASTAGGTTGSAGAHTHTTSGTAASAGAHSHTITVDSGGAHAHTASSNSTGAHTHTVSGSNANTGSGTAFNTLDPYITVYMWKRTA